MRQVNPTPPDDPSSKPAPTPFYARWLNRTQTPRQYSRQEFLLRVVLIVIVGTALVYAGLRGGKFLLERFHRDPDPRRLPRPEHLLTQDDIRFLLSGHDLVNSRDSRIDVRSGGNRYLVQSSIDGHLQAYLLKRLNPRYARYIGIVVMEPDTGRVLSLIDFDRQRNGRHPSVESRFPAASIIKIITAAAAMESGGITPETSFHYNGRSHTLYRSQLKRRKNRYSNRITLKRAFARSVNPVFGKLAMHYLEDGALLAYANRFGFNQRLPFEMDIHVSAFEIPVDAYQSAELASGFNRRTRMSPIHAALIASTVINQGVMPRPTLVDSVYSANGRLVYEGDDRALAHAVPTDTADGLKEMMLETVTSGTCRRLFRPYRRDRVLKKLRIGGKSGSIDSKGHDARYDWFVGFAESEAINESIAVAVMVAHEKYIGVKAGDYARYAIREHFNALFKQIASKAT
jgi:cell division protein FtsI/penicillin-binding protein 2